MKNTSASEMNFRQGGLYRLLAGNLICRMQTWLRQSWLRGLFLLFFLFACSYIGSAQVLRNETDSTGLLKSVPQWEDDSLGRRTPRGTVAGFLKSMSEQNYSRAARYLKIDNSFLDQKNTRTKRNSKRQLLKPKAVAPDAFIDGEELAQRLQRLLDQNGSLLPYSWISDAYDGGLNDNLTPNLDRVGKASFDGKTIDILLEKDLEPDGAPVWLFSAQTMAQVLLIQQPEQASSLIDRFLPNYLKEHTLGTVPIGYWLVLLILVATAYLLAWILTGFLVYILPFVWGQANQEPTSGVIKAFRLPVRIFIAVWLYSALNQMADISIIIRQRISEITTVVGLIAVLLLLWRVTVVLTQFSEKRIARRGNMAAVSAVLFLSRVAKAAIVVFGLIAVLYTLGFDVTTGLAALGIGGIALALGAQKTVENFVGSVALIVDQPIRVGDFCKVGETTGIVEQIGMRSTRIRTLDRTIVTIPNGEFSSLRIENYAHRDRFWFHPVLAMHFQTTPDQIRFMLAQLNSFLKSHSSVDPESARIRFVGIGTESLNLEIFAYVTAPDYNAFLIIQENLLLHIVDTVRASGSSLAFPTQTLYLHGDSLSRELSKETRHRMGQPEENTSKTRHSNRSEDKDIDVVSNKSDGNRVK